MQRSIGLKVREGAPLASYAIDRRCLRKGTEAASGNNVEALICFFCACIYPYMGGTTHLPIRWHRAFGSDGGNQLFNHSCKDAYAIFGFETFLGNYARDPEGHFDLHRRIQEFDDWYVDAHFDE